MRTSPERQAVYDALAKPPGSVPDIPVVPPMPDSIEWLGKLTSVSIKPGDVLVVMCPKRLSVRGYDRITETTKQHFPDNKVVILEDGITLGVVRKETDET